MKAVILAGGQGTRLKSVIHEIPKPMAPVNGRPFLEFLVSRLVSHGISEIILSVGYLYENIVAHFGNGSQLQASISYCIEPEPLGTGGAVRESLAMAGRENVLVINGDTFVAADIKKLSDFHELRRTIATMTVIPMDDASRYGSVKVSPAGLVTAFTEKENSGSGLINAGIYVFSAKMLDLMPAGRVSLETDILPKLAGAGQLAAQVQNVPFIDIGIPESYREFCLNSSKYTDVIG